MDEHDEDTCVLAVDVLVAGALIVGMGALVVDGAVEVTSTKLESLEKLVHHLPWHIR